MVTYREIAETETDPEAALTSDLFKALQKNLLASLEGDPTAPVNQWAWHPYNKVLNGDSNTGIIWDMVTNGAAALIESPDFLEGYDYGFFGVGLRQTSAAAASISCQLLYDVNWSSAGNAGYNFCNGGAASGGGPGGIGWMELWNPRNVGRVWSGFGIRTVISASRTAGSQTIDGVEGQETVDSFVRRVRFRGGNGGNVTGTTSPLSYIRMYKRRSLIRN